MAKLSHAESRRLYSWWWDSHISPKNSKWLHENLADMDIKVKSMIKIIEEDADSFRKRAEMYYRKRPELIKLVEEFYRAYRALAERYDHATGALRQAHRTMAEAFPEQIPLLLPDESTESSSPSGETRTPESTVLVSSYPTPFKGDELFLKEFDSTMIKEASRQSTTGEIFANGWARKKLNFQDVETKGKDFADDVQKEDHSLSEEPQNLKNQIEHESIRADKAEAEVEIMKGTVSELESEKEALSLQYKLSEEKISSLQEDLKKLNDEMLIGMTKLRIVEYRCHQLEKENQSLQLELGLLKETVKEQQKELEKLSISLKEGDRYTRAGNLGSQSQKEARFLSMEIQDMERIKVGLEEEIQRLKEETGSLKEQICFSALEIKRLQDEITFLEESNGKLENELGMQVVDKKSLQQEIWYLKSEKKDLEKRHHEMMEQIGVVNLNVESLQEMVKELRDGTVELKELCKKHEDEGIQHFEKLKFIENITEQNAVLEKSLSSAYAELEELRDMVKTLKESCETLQGKISMHISEKAVLVMQIEAISQGMEKLSDKNDLLENSLSDMTVEFEDLKGKLNVLEELCQSLRDQNSNFIDEMGTLVTELERMNRSLENLERRYSQLEAENLNTEKEKEHILSQVTALQNSLRIEKEEHETLMRSSTSQLATLESQIIVMREHGLAREEMLEQEHHMIIYAQIEIFILQRSLHDMKERNMFLSDKCRRYSETSKCQEKLFSALKKESYIEKKRLTCLSQCIESLKTYILDAQDENQQLIIEKRVFLTLVEQYGMYLAELQSDKSDLERESKTRLEELLVLQSEKHQIMEHNEQLRQNVYACNQNLSELREAYSTLQSHITQLIEENQSFAKKIVGLIEENDSLKVDNSTLEAQRMNLEHLYLIFSSYNAERSLELQQLSDKMDQLHLVNTGIEHELRSLNEKLVDVEIENMYLKQSLVNMEERRSQLENLKDLLVKKEEELLEVNHQVEGLLMDVDGAKLVREELENKNQTLLKYKAQMGKEITHLRQTNGTLTQQVGKLFEEVVEYKKREEFFISQLEDRNKLVECCEVEMATLINDSHITTIGAATFEEKMLDLLITCESLEICAMVQKEMFCEEIAKRNVYEDKLKEELDSMDGENRGLKNKVNAYLPRISLLANSVTSLEQHILSLANHHSLRSQEKQDSPPPFQQKRCRKGGIEDHNATLAFGIFELQKLHAKVNALESVVMDIQSHLEHDIFVSRTALQDGAAGSGELKAKWAPDQEEDEAAAICKDIILHLQKKEETGNLIKGKDKCEQTMKDIQLDHVLISSYYENGSSSNAPSGIGSDETNDRMIELWETIDDSKMEKKEPSIDKLEITNKETEAHQECNGSISGRLSSDCQRLSILQKTVKELIRNMEIYEVSSNPTSPEFKKVHLRSKEVEENILHLIDTYKKLAKMAQQHDEMDQANERKLSVRARKGSEKIGRLELELLKIEYVWLKLKEELDYKRARDAERRTKVLLRDYFYGRKESPRRRKVHCCACLRPRTKE